MTHGYSLRPNTKGRQPERHQSTDETKEQVEGTLASTSTSTSTSTSSTSEGQQQTLTNELECESGTVDPRPATPDTPRAQAAHNSLVPWHWHSRNIVASSATGISAPTTTRYRVEDPPDEIQAARKREEARRTADAVRIRREQIVGGYEEELRMLRARIEALRCECVVKVEKARRKSERKWASERGEVVVAVDSDGDGDEGNLMGENAESDREDADGGEMAVDKHYAQRVTTSLTTNNGDDKQQWQWSTRSSPFANNWSHRSESNFLPPPPLRKTQQQQQQDDERGLAGEVHTVSQSNFPPPPPLRKTQQQQLQQDDERGPGEIHTVSHTSRRLLRKNHPSQGWPSSHSRPRPRHPQPLQRQQTQLMAIPTSSHSQGLHTYSTAILDPETEICISGTDGDKEDSEMEG
jgi:hypothetical protein